MSLTYKDALALKEAGFPQTGIDYNWGCQHAQHSSCIDSSCNELTYFPTLSELIEACGDRFHAIQRMSVPIGINHPVTWVAYSNEKSELNIEAHFFQQGSSPEQAVANLWLALNKK